MTPYGEAWGDQYIFVLCEPDPKHTKSLLVRPTIDKSNNQLIHYHLHSKKKRSNWKRPHDR